MNTKGRNDDAPGVIRGAMEVSQTKKGNDRKSAANRERKKAPQKYWLHVRPDGSEKHYRRPPISVAALTVHIIEDRANSVTERTFTRRAFDNDSGHWISVPPRGAGWVYEAPASSGSDSWLRVRS